MKVYVSQSGSLYQRAPCQHLGEPSSAEPELLAGSTDLPGLSNDHLCGAASGGTPTLLQCLQHARLTSSVGTKS